MHYVVLIARSGGFRGHGQQNQHYGLTKQLRSRRMLRTPYCLDNKSSRKGSLIDGQRAARGLQVVQEENYIGFVQP
jgi:hypothetical protein